jgi:pimeloyl-ACP methyl ester carboxylesterase
MEVMGNRNRLIGDLHVEIRGCGPPILLIHGFGASSFTWSKIIPSLAADHTIISLDLKGFGQSRKPRDGRYALQSQAAAVLNVINTLGLDDLTVIGHSMGGGIALLVAMELEKQRPRRLNRLILIDSIACPQPLPLFIKVLRLPILGPVVLKIVPATWQVRYVLRQVYFNPGKIERDFVEEYAAPLRCRDGRAALIATALAIIPPDAEKLIARYKQIRSPVLLLWGSHDRIVPISLAARLKAAIPGARYKVVPSCGHAPQEEEPQETLFRINEFLRALPANGQTAPLGERRPTSFPENNPSAARRG